MNSFITAHIFLHLSRLELLVSSFTVNPAESVLSSVRLSVVECESKNPPPRGWEFLNNF